MQRKDLLNTLAWKLENAPLVGGGIQIRQVVPGKDHLAVIMVDKGKIVTVKLAVEFRTVNARTNGVENDSLVEIEQVEWIQEQGYGVVGATGTGQVHHPVVVQGNVQTACGREIVLGPGQWMMVEEEVTCRSCLKVMEMEREEETSE